MKKVLLVEDDKWFAEHIGRVVSGDYEITHVMNPLDAIDALDDGKFDAVILDMMLTVANALALMQEMQSHEDLSAIPIIVCSTLARDMSLEQLQPYNVVALLDKTTMQPSDIITALESYV